MTDRALKCHSESRNIQFRTTGGIHNEHCFRGKAFVKNQLICDPFANDYAIVSYSLRDIHPTVNSFSNVAKVFGLAINIEKSQLLYLSRPNYPTALKTMVFVDGKAV